MTLERVGNRHPIDTIRVSSDRNAGLLAFAMSGLLVAAFVISPLASANETILVSKSPSSTTGASEAIAPVISPNGRYVLFTSFAPNLVPGDRNRDQDLFVFDRTTGLSKRIDLPHYLCDTIRTKVLSGAFSANGRFVLVGYEDWCVAGDDNVDGLVIRFDQLTGTTTRVMVGTDSVSEMSASDDGRFIAMELHGFETPMDTQIWLHDALAGTIIQLSKGISGSSPTPYSRSPAISADGNLVVFESDANNLIANDTNESTDIFLYTRSSGKLSRISKSTAGTQANGRSFDPSISADGAKIAFASRATNLAASDTNSNVDIFIRDRVQQTTTRVSLGVAQVQADDRSDLPSLSADGRFVAFRSEATNLVANDTNGVSDIFVRNLVTRATSRVSSIGAQGNAESLNPSISATGRFVAFESSASNFFTGDKNLVADIFAYDRQLAEMTAVSKAVGPVGGLEAIQPSISSSGRYIAFGSRAPNLNPEDTSLPSVFDIFVHDSSTNRTALASVPLPGEVADESSFQPSLSGDGQLVAFISLVEHLVSGDDNGTFDVFVRNLVSGTTARVSESSNGVPGNGASLGPKISTDGRYVAFLSEATNLVAGDTNGVTDLFVKNLATGNTRRMNVSTAGTQADEEACCHAISEDGRYVAFGTFAMLVPAADRDWGVFVRDRQSNTIAQVALTLDGDEAADLRSEISISGDGRYVAFVSSRSNVVAGDDNGRADVFVRDRASGMTSLVSVLPPEVNLPPNTSMTGISLSADGRFVSFVTSHPDPISDFNILTGIYVHDRVESSTIRVDVSSAEKAASEGGNSAALSADGNFVVFLSQSTNLTPEPIASTSAYVRRLTESPTPTFLMSPTGHAFGNLAVGATSSARKVTVSNTGSLPLFVDSIAIAGSGRAHFSQTNDCPARLAVSTKCTVLVKFEPSSVGAKIAVLRLTPGGGGSSKTIALSGTGT